MHALTHAMPHTNTAVQFEDLRPFGGRAISYQVLRNMEVCLCVRACVCLWVCVHVCVCRFSLLCVCAASSIKRLPHLPTPTPTTGISCSPLSFRGLRHAFVGRIHIYACTHPHTNTPTHPPPHTHAGERLAVHCAVPSGLGVRIPDRRRGTRVCVCVCVCVCMRCLCCVHRFD